MALAYDTHLTPATGSPEPSTPIEKVGAALNISVVFTSVRATLSAFKEAGILAKRLRGCITLVVPQVVPYPLPLTSPPVLLDWSERRFHVMARESAVEARVQLYLCRDRLDALRSVLRPRSLVIVGGPKRWWPTSEKRLAGQLRRAGHEVIFKEME